MNLKSIKESWLGDVIEFVATAGTGAGISMLLEKKGFSKESANTLGNLFHTRLFGVGKQDEVNDWISLCGLFHFEELDPDRLPPGMDATACIERLGQWAYGLKPGQRSALVLTFGTLFGDVSGTFMQQPPARATMAITPAGPTTTTIGPSVDPHAAFKAAQQAAAETMLPLLWLHDDTTRTKVAIGFGLIPRHDYVFEAADWIKKLEAHKKLWAGPRAAGKGIAIGTVVVAQFLKDASESQKLEDLADRLEDGNERLQKFNLLGKLINWLTK